MGSEVTLRRDTARRGWSLMEGTQEVAHSAQGATFIDVARMLRGYNDYLRSNAVHDHVQRYLLNRLAGIISLDVDGSSVMSEAVFDGDERLEIPYQAYGVSAEEPLSQVGMELKRTKVRTTLTMYDAVVRNEMNLESLFLAGATELAIRRLQPREWENPTLLRLVSGDNGEWHAEEDTFGWANNIGPIDGVDASDVEIVLSAPVQAPNGNDDRFTDDATDTDGGPSSDRPTGTLDDADVSDDAD